MITGQMETITVAQAKQMIAGHKNYRKIVEKRVVEYANLMNSGNWLVSTISVDEDGLLLDGQHRLSALIKFGKPIDFFVMRGVPKLNIVAIDNGMSRSAGAIISAELGVKNGQSLAAIAKILLLDEVSHYHYSIPVGNAVIVQTVIDNQFIVDLARAADKGFTRNGMILGAFARCILKNMDKKDDLVMCAAKCSSGDWQEENMSGFRLLIANRGKHSGISRSVDLYMRTARAICAYMDGEIISKLYKCDRDPFSRKKQ